MRDSTVRVPFVPVLCYNRVEDVTKMAYKLLVSDIDGTLLDEKGNISAENKKALARLAATGMQITLSTGRAMPAALVVLKELSLDGYHIFADGALVIKPKTGEIPYARTIDMKVVRKAVRFVQANKMDIDFFSATRYLVERESWISDIRRKFFAVNPVIIDLTQIPDDEKIIKGTLVVRSKEERAKATLFCEQFKDSLSFSLTKTPAYPDIDFINVISPGVSKGEAVEALARHLGITLAEVAAIGDGINDIPLLSAVGLAIAMGHSPDALKAIAHYVTTDINHDGFAAAVNKLLL
jgi:5-amino-6-(5-phospho-D-ribitylamino)uracil phosphatase